MCVCNSEKLIGDHSFQHSSRMDSQAAREMHQRSTQGRYAGSGAPGAPRMAAYAAGARKQVAGAAKPPIQTQMGQKSFQIRSWHVHTAKCPILSASEIEQYEQVLDIPIPEMIFGNNSVALHHASGFAISFNALDALKLVDINPSNLIKVSYANDWFQSRIAKHSKSEMEVYKPYDWTYSSKYKGTTAAAGVVWSPTDREIPVHKLTSDNPIIFFDDMILYEDELGDNGESILNVKIRVMADCLLVLQRLFVRVDEVLVRIFDTRLFIDFDNDEILREFKIQEDDYITVLNKGNIKGSGSSDPKRNLRDIHWCSGVLPVKEIHRECISLSQR